MNQYQFQKPFFNLTELPKFAAAVATQLLAVQSVSVAIDLASREVKDPDFVRKAGWMCHDLENGTTLSAVMQKHPEYFSADVVTKVQAIEVDPKITNRLEAIRDVFDAISTPVTAAEFWPRDNPLDGLFPNKITPATDLPDPQSFARTSAAGLAAAERYKQLLRPYLKSTTGSMAETVVTTSPIGPDPIEAQRSRIDKIRKEQGSV